MALLNEVNQMQAQGISEDRIAQRLKEQGNNPMEINQAIEQSKIKSAITVEADAGNAVINSMSQTGMQQSISDEAPPQEEPLEAPQEAYAPEGVQYEDYPSFQEQAPAQGYEEYQSYQPQSPELVNEIAEQIVNEKFESIKQDIVMIKELKSSSDKRMKDLDDRLKRMEDMLDVLQTTILGKIGSHIKTIEDIKKEMSMMQNTFSSALNPLVESYREDKKISSQKSQQSNLQNL